MAQSKVREFSQLQTAELEASGAKRGSSISGCGPSGHEMNQGMTRTKCAEHVLKLDITGPKTSKHHTVHFQYVDLLNKIGQIDLD